MPSKEVEFHEEALAEAQAAYDWYATRNAAAAEAFIGELDHAVERIGMFPERDGPLKSAATQPQTISRNQCRIGGQSLSPHPQIRIHYLRTHSGGGVAPVRVAQPS